MIDTNHQQSEAKEMRNDFESRTNYFRIALRGLLVALCALFAGSVLASPASAEIKWDASFGNDGRSDVGPIGIGSDAFLNDGQVLLSGAGISASRVDPNGLLDESFGDDGIAKIDYRALGFEGKVTTTSIDVGDDGRVTLAGFISERHPINGVTVRAFLARLDSSGAPDKTFGRGGITRIKTTGVTSAENQAIYALAHQRDGSVIAAGRDVFRRGLVVRIKANGKLDRSFGKGGRASVARADDSNPMTVSSVQTLPNDQIMIVASQSSLPSVVRLKPNGKTDRTFGGSDGRKPLTVKSDPITPDLNVLPNGKSVVLLNERVGSSAWRRPVLARLTARGQWDRTLGSNGIARFSSKRLAKFYGYDRPVPVLSSMIASQSDGSTLVASRFATKPVVFRVKPDGEPDRSFADAGLFRTTESTGNFIPLVAPSKRITVAGVEGSNRVLYRIFP
ncbi:MAG: hypothetical protein JJE13_04335 [Thermoleophilia bacterium]|nr:hypothetical protein [Thermoleophilia bacterium]